MTLSPKWLRKNFPDPEPNLSLRELSELETSRDLQKSLQQLLCDAHEECLNPLPNKTTDETQAENRIILQLQRLVGAQKRTASLQAVIAFEASRTNTLILRLTFVIAILSVVLARSEIRSLLAWIGF
jgi:hypothetical protein